jgi:16S rRNA (guanine527-N7)-methyltransferase
VAAVLRRHGADPAAAQAILQLLAALAAERDPPTTVREPRQALDVHVADSLSGLRVPELRSAPALCDLGAGAGFPGLPLAVALPSARVDLVESSARKAATIERLAAAADAGRARAVALRAEEWAAGDGREAYDAVTARALAALPVLCEYAAPLLRPGGALVAWKGRRERDEERAGERAAVEVGLEPARVLPVEPFEGAHSLHLHVFLKAAPTPPRFPRRPGVARRRPLGRG